VEHALVKWWEDREEETMEQETVVLSGDVWQMQEEVYHGVITVTVDEFIGDSSIEDAVDEFIAAYPDMFGDNPPVYIMRMTCSEYTLRELLIGYLERMTE
jgi:hypothetical protein